MSFCECKLILHRKTKGNEDILFSSKDFPRITPGCLLEIYQLDNEKHNILKVESVNLNFLQKDTISIEQQLASSLRLIQNKMVKFKVIDEAVVTLDVLDLVFKDQYLSRGDMYRFTRAMRRSVLQVNKKIEFVPYRGHVGDMWCRGQRISCGYVGDNTRVVFRSATSVVHIFIQMSQEMWEFDYFGELYFDKAINFISDLFIRWNDNNCGHDVTIVLFSRLFYKNITENDIPINTKRNLKTDYKGRLYEDFYYIVVQNERYMLADWRKVVKNLKLCFSQYKFDLEQFNQKNFNTEPPTEVELSTAEDANFLETLNMALNLYETYYVDRNFDRTGKICVVITAGPGVYNVDRVQTNLTKQRICDLGVGMDLVCLGEQPLHAVPLFIFQQKKSQVFHDNQYYIPYWINHSFYRSVNEMQAIQLGKFIPRIKVRIEKILDNEKIIKTTNHDNDISNGNLSISPINFMRNVTKSECTQSGSFNNLAPDNDSVLSTSNKCERGVMFSSFFESVTSKDDSCIRPVKSIGKRSHLSDSPKALFNPFAPNGFNVGTTSNSRRWSHVFPIDSNNKPIQLHHQLVINSPSQLGIQGESTKNMSEAWKNYYKAFESHNKGSCNESIDSCSSPATTMTKDTSQFISPKALFYEPEEGVNATTTDNIGSDKTSDTSIISPLPSSFQGAGSQKYFPPSSSNKGSINRKVHTLFTEGEQKWSWDSPKEDDSPINHMGVDWKSLILPAILPITSDYYPSAKDLEYDFLEYNYQLMANSLDSNEDNSVSSRRPLSINEVFQELILQRLSQGFQLIVDPPTFKSVSNSINHETKKKIKTKKKNAVYRFGLGRIYHSIEMKQDLIHVTQYSSRHANNVQDIPYKYCMKMPDSTEYMMFRTKFSMQMLEKFNWNYHDHYILNYGGNVNEDSVVADQQYKLIPSLKFWRSRFFLLPLHSATKTIMEVDKCTRFRCDIYDEKTLFVQNTLVDDFFKFLQVINKIKRRASNSKTKFFVAHMNSMVDNSPTVFNSSAMSKVKSASSNLLNLKFTFDSTESVMKPLTPTENDRLSDASPISRVLEAMTSPQTGMTFLPLSEFPNEYTFTSYECVHWCKRNMDNITDVKSAVTYLQKLMNLKYIMHATECPSHKFIYGFIFYCLSDSCRKLCSGWQDSNDNSIAASASSSLGNLATDDADATSKFKRRNIEWVEVSLASLEVDGKVESEWFSDLSGRKSSGFYLSGDFPKQIESLQSVEFLAPTLVNRVLVNCFTRDNIFGITGNCHDPEMLYENNGVLYKKVVLDVENDKEERPEWGIFQFHANYHPTMAFEFMLQWLVATGGKLAEKVSQWTRKISNLQLIAVPCDPFALPSSINSDPLRGPIFVPLTVSCLLNFADSHHSSSGMSIEDTIAELFAAFPESERLYRLMLMQESILKRFGFIKESCVNYTTKTQIHTKTSKLTTQSNGDMCIEAADQSENIGGNTIKWSYVHYSGGMFAMIPHYKMNNAIYDQTNGIIFDDEEWDAPNIGFLWSWNKMLTRKNNPASMVVDEQFQDRMFADFKDFCNNRDNRLKQFFDDAKFLIDKHYNHVQ